MSQTICMTEELMQKEISLFHTNVASNVNARAERNTFSTLSTLNIITSTS